MLSLQHPLQILHIEDNEGDAQFARIALCEGLRRTGCYIERAKCVLDGLRLIKDKLFDIVLLDLHLGDAQGLTALLQVKSRAPDTPIVVLTGREDVNLALDCVEEGAQDYLIKGSCDSRSMTVSVLSSIQRKQQEKELFRLAHHDSLTGLPNRSRFLEHLGQALLHGARWNHRQAVMFMDVNGFKSVNDTHGHSVGDELLRQIAGRLRNGLRACDVLARYAGDEFIVHLDSEESIGIDDCVRVATKLTALFERPFKIEDVHLHSGVSIGIALFPEAGNDVATLIEQADMAMYKAKKANRAYAFADPADKNAEELVPALTH